MARVFQSIFVNPPVAIARLGGSSNPMDAFTWGPEANPRAGADTAVRPDWTLDVQPDGSVLPRMPDALAFRDAGLVRPVCPFFEIWAWMGEPQSAAATWEAVPLTPTLLQSQGLTTGSVTLRFTAMNAKAARRRNDPRLRFGTFPALEIRASVLSATTVRGVSPPGIANPMIPAGRHIPLGSLRFLRSTPQPASGATAWADIVNVEILRFRYTPPLGRFYGPPASAQSRPTGDGRSAVAVPAAQAFLDPAAGWFNQATVALDAPADTYDAVDAGAPTGRSLGVVDDTCDARIVVELRLSSGQSLSTAATLFVGPPDYAPDRRPFLSLADEINDREADAQARSTALTREEQGRWVEDLFERAFETVSLMNVDNWRRAHAKTLTAAERKAPLANDGLVDDRAMGAADRLRNPTHTVAPVVPGVNPLPLSSHARMRHRALSDRVELERFVRANPGRLRDLIRTPFEIAPGEGPSPSAQELTTMRMPPFMRNSNAQPLTLSVWQHELVQRWATLIEGSPSPAAVAVRMAAAAPMSDAAARRMEEVLSRLDTQVGP